MVKAKVSPRRPTAAWRPNPQKRVTSMALTKATKTLSNVSVDTANSSTQRGNIKVIVRVRPPNLREKTVNSRIVVHPVDSHMVVFDPPDDEGNEFYFKGVRQNYQQGKRHKNLKMAFDNVYGPQSTNDEIFDDIINPLLDTLLTGYNCSVFAYGATGSGKTHTMIGSKDNPGLTYQTVMELYRRLEEMDKDFETEVAVSYLEVYNEAIRDLLNTSSGDLQIREDTNGVVVANLTAHKPKDSTELLELLARGNSVRSQHPTDHNAESSRSHAVFQVSIQLRARFTELTNKYKSAKLAMVDLAGSEKGAATGFQGQRFREGASINKSLLSLGNCINALADGKRHIPYRDSKLTRILKDSLGGNCKTVMIANVSPSSLSFDDSYNTLRYADRAKRIKFQVKKNTMSVSTCLTQYVKVVEEMSHRIENLEKELNEYKRKAAANKVERADVSTETETTTSVSTPSHNSHGMDMSSMDIDNSGFQPQIPLSVITNITDLTRRREEVVKTLNDANSAATVASVKIEVKQRRIETIKKLKSVEVDKKTIKIQKQLPPLKERRRQALSKREKAVDILGKLDNEIKAYQVEYFSESKYMPIQVSDFFELQSLKVEKIELTGVQNNLQDTSKLYMDEWDKSESLLGESLAFLSAQYLMSKHYDRATTKNDQDYEKLVSNLCGTKVQWSTTMEKPDQPVPLLQRILSEKQAEVPKPTSTFVKILPSSPVTSRNKFKRALN